MIRLKGLIGIAVLVMAMIFGVVYAGNAEPGVCPDGGNWTKVDSDDLSTFPVEGATEYCFKAGNHDTVSEIPDGGFGQEGSCQDGIQFCDLSHWSYFIPEPTDVPPTETPEPTPTEPPTETPTTPPVEPTPTTPPTIEPTPYQRPTCEPIDPNGTCSGGLG